MTRLVMKILVIDILISLFVRYQNKIFKLKMFDPKPKGLILEDQKDL
jgi:hypothetical protein